MLSPRNVPPPKGNSHQHSPWDGLALSVHWKTLHFSSAVMLRSQSWPLWKWEKELTLSVVKVRIWLWGFHGQCVELTRSLHCPVASWRNPASPMWGPRKRLISNFVLHLELYQTEGKIPILYRQCEGQSCRWTATFPGLFELWVTSFPLQKPQHHCPVSQKWHLPPLCSFPCSWTC